MATEFVIRASGADKAAMKHMVCRFPQSFKPDPASGELANAPDLKHPGEAWVMGQMEDAEARPGTRGWAPPLPPPPPATRFAVCTSFRPQQALQSLPPADCHPSLAPRPCHPQSAGPVGAGGAGQGAASLRGAARGRRARHRCRLLPAHEGQGKRVHCGARVRGLHLQARPAAPPPEVSPDAPPCCPAC